MKNFLIAFALIGFTSNAFAMQPTHPLMLAELTLTEKIELATQKRDEADRLEREKNPQAAARYDKEARERQAKYQKFRKQMKVGDDTTDGIVIEVKGNLVKTQTSEEQCTQRDSDNKCLNYVNTSVEKWFKRSEIYPHD